MLKVRIEYIEWEYIDLQLIMQYSIESVFYELLIYLTKYIVYSMKSEGEIFYSIYLSNNQTIK